MSSTQLGSFTSIRSDPALPHPFLKRQKRFSKLLQDPKVLSDKTLQILTTFNNWQKNKESWTHSLEREKFYQSIYNFKNKIKPSKKESIGLTPRTPPPMLRFSNLSALSRKSDSSTLMFSQKCRLSRGKNVNKHRYELLGSWEEKRLKLNLKGSMWVLKRESFTLLNYHYIEGIFYYPAGSVVEAVALMVFEIAAKYIPYLFDHFKWTFLVSYLRWLTHNSHPSISGLITKQPLDTIKSIFLQYLELLRTQTTRSLLQRYDIATIASIGFRQGMIDAKSDREENLRSLEYDPPLKTIIQFLEEECGFETQLGKEELRVSPENHQFVVRWEGGKVYYKLNY